MNLPALIPIWQSEQSELRIFAQDRRAVASAIADKYRAGRVCCEGRCSCDLDAEGSASDRDIYARMQRDAHVLTADARMIGRRIYRAERILAARQVPSPRFTHICTSSYMKEAA